jgi:hypothetical protein
MPHKISKKEKMLGSFVPVTPEFLDFVENNIKNNLDLEKVLNAYKASIVRGMDYAMVEYYDKYKKPNLLFFAREHFKQTVLRHYYNSLKSYKPRFKCPRKLKKDSDFENRTHRLYRIFDLKNNKDISGIRMFKYCKKTFQRKVIVPN